MSLEARRQAPLDSPPIRNVNCWAFPIYVKTGESLSPIPNQYGGPMVKLIVRDRESIQEAVRRFRKLVERSGIKKEMRRREYYEKPSEIRRRARLRAERRARRPLPVRPGM
jgi:small subunit ribosomal protein S21